MRLGLRLLQSPDDSGAREEYPPRSAPDSATVSESSANLDPVEEDSATNGGEEPKGGSDEVAGD
ncbi:MAG TPA: hypothetical protein VGE59_00350 [Patescibacteria group bacterium]